MATKTITISIPELCAKVGIKEPPKGLAVRYEMRKGGNAKEGLWEVRVGGGYYGADCILSINDKIEIKDDTDAVSFEENERWNKTECNCHAKGRGYYHEKTCAVVKELEAIINDRKPLLATVRGIKLVERCECGGKEKEHCIAGKGMICTSHDCSEYKPVQTVEITTEKKED